MYKWCRHYSTFLFLFAFCDVKCCRSEFQISHKTMLTTTFHKCYIKYKKKNWFILWVDDKQTYCYVQCTYMIIISTIEHLFCCWLSNCFIFFLFNALVTVKFTLWIPRKKIFRNVIWNGIFFIEILKATVISNVQWKFG